MHGQQLELRDLRQDLIDEWVTAGRSQRRRVRMFLAWLARAEHTTQLQVAWDQHPATRTAIGDPQRLELLERLLYDDALVSAGLKSLQLR